MAVSVLYNFIKKSTLYVEEINILRRTRDFRKERRVMEYLIKYKEDN